MFFITITLLNANIEKSYKISS